MPSPRKYTGQIADGSGLYFYNARYYDPGLGRFVSPDTIKENVYNPQLLNSYTYVSNSPLIYVDPTGHFCRPDKCVKKVVVGASKAAVNVAATATGVVVNVADPILEKVEPVINPIAKPQEAIINNTIVPALNLTGAGIEKIEINPTYGYVGVQVNDGGWAADAMDTVVDHSAITIPTAPLGPSVVIQKVDSFKEEGKLEKNTKHEQVHVTQQKVLGPFSYPCTLRDQQCGAMGTTHLRSKLIHTAKTGGRISDMSFKYRWPTVGPCLSSKSTPLGN